MTHLYVARSKTLTEWASDVGLSKHIYKLGLTADAAKPAIENADWCGMTDWSLVKATPCDLAVEDEEAVIRRIAAKEKMIDPSLYPKLKGQLGVFKVLPAHVESHIVVGKALDGNFDVAKLKLKPADFAAYLFANALR
ncbi:MAG TPA: hypothetical protein VL574_08830 [Stellaceae bacterium]|jgi:hypothetical protein|nr:hypothetical protein [Stellaceae bacterium]